MVLTRNCDFVVTMGGRLAGQSFALARCCSFWTLGSYHKRAQLESGVMLGYDAAESVLNDCQHVHR